MARVVRKKDMKHAIARRETTLKKLSNPNDADDPRWLKAALGHIDARIVKKENAKPHRQSQKVVGHKRRKASS